MPTHPSLPKQIHPDTRCGLPLEQPCVHRTTSTLPDTPKRVHTVPLLHSMSSIPATPPSHTPSRRRYWHPEATPRVRSTMPSRASRPSRSPMDCNPVTRFCNKYETELIDLFNNNSLHGFPAEVTEAEAPITLREFAPEDFEALCRMDLAMSVELLGEEDTYGENWIRKRTTPGRHSFLNWRTFSAVVEGRPDPVGFVMSMYNKGHGFVELFWLMVDPAFRRRGVAGNLINKMIQSAHADWKTYTFRLHCLETNAGGLSFYQSLYWKKVLLKQDYPERGVNSWRLRLDVDPQTLQIIQ